MADRTTITWTSATWNPVRGCSRESEGCRRCYAEGIAARFSGPGLPYEGLADRSRRGSKWTGKVVLVEDMLRLPLSWRAPRRVFVNSMSDLFHEGLADAAIDQVFAVMLLAQQHTFQALTKRSARMRAYLNDPGTPDRIDAAADAIAPAAWCRREIEVWPLPNVWAGVSVEDQPAAERRVIDLLDTWAAVRFLSCEPLLSALDLSRIQASGGVTLDALTGNRSEGGPAWTYAWPGPKVDWVIVGGESGHGARPMRREWATTILDQCAAAGVPAFFKQTGSARGEGLDWDGIPGKGEDPAHWDDALRVQSFPTQAPA